MTHTWTVRILAVLLIGLTALGIRQFLRLTDNFIAPQAKQSSAPPEGQVRTILLLHSYHQGYLWTDELTEGIKASLEKLPHDLIVEYMDTKRHNSPRYFEGLAQNLAIKHQGRRIDAIISTDDNAFRFMAEQHERIFPGVPWVFTGVNYLEPSRLKDLKDVTGVNEAADLGSNLTLIRQVLPQTRRVALVVDDTETGLRIQEAWARTPGQGLELSLIHGLDFPLLAQRLQTLEAGTVVLLAFYFRDPSGAFLEYDKSTHLVSSNSRVPVFACWDFSLNGGVVGGRVVNGRQQGLAAGQLALECLAGSPPGSLPVIMDTPTSLVIDHAAAKAAGIDPTRFPPDASFINRPSTFFDQYRDLVLDAVAFLTLLILGISLLVVWLISSRRQTLALEQHIQERTLALEDSLTKLKLAQSQLVETEKQAALGSMVAGIAHEINNPLGIGLTAATYLEKQSLSLKSEAAEGAITRSHFLDSLQALHESARIVHDNLQRAAGLVANFKQIATDQSNQEYRSFQLREYLERIRLSLSPRFNGSPHVLVIDCPETAVLTSYPGAFYQVISNLVLNAQEHGLEPGRHGRIELSVDNSGPELLIHCTDDGRGIPPAVMPHIFEPFFTTKRGQGGTGLGLHICWNLVNQTLRGSLACESRPGRTRFTLRLPRVLV